MGELQDKPTHGSVRHASTILRRWFRCAIRVCLVIYWLLLFGLMHVPMSDLPQPPPILEIPEKVLHFGTYAVLAVLLALSIERDRPRATLRRRWLVLGLVIPLYGLFDEATQPFFSRDFEWLDWCADVAGAAAGLFLVTIVSLPALFRREETRFL